MMHNSNETTKEKSTEVQNYERAGSEVVDYRRR